MREVTLASRSRRGRYADAHAGQLCDRCHALRRGNVWKAHDAIADIDPAVFKAQLQALVKRRRYALCVKVVDASDFEGSYIATLAAARLEPSPGCRGAR